MIHVLAVTREEIAGGYLQHLLRVLSETNFQDNLKAPALAKAGHEIMQQNVVVRATDGGLAPDFLASRFGSWYSFILMNDPARELLDASGATHRIVGQMNESELPQNVNSQIPLLLGTHRLVANRT